MALPVQGEGAPRLQVQAAAGGGHLAVVTELGPGAPVTNSAEDTWDALRAARPGQLALPGHWPTAESPGDGQHPDQVVIGPGRQPAWRRVRPVPDASPRHQELAAQMRAHGHRIPAVSHGISTKSRRLFRPRH